MSLNRLSQPAAAVLPLLLALSAGACGASRGTQGPERPTGVVDENAGLVLGEFPLSGEGVVDGDTIRVGGLDGSLRLLGLDTEETFKSERDLRDFEAGWEQYLASRQARTSRPVKIPTPLGEDAKHFAQDFFAGVSVVRLERDHPREIRGRFNRFLTYVFIERDGTWVNYNVECVRAGMSPYFTKYGYSRRFHDQFLQAQEEARSAQRGIWDPTLQHYRDYPERLQWWNARADFIQEFEREAEDRQDLITLTHWNALQRLEGLEGRYVTVLATVGEIRRGSSGPTRAMLSRRMFADLPAVFFDSRVFQSSRIEDYRGEYVRVRGRVNTWTNPRNGRSTLQLIVNVASEVTVPPYTPPGGGAPETEADEP